MKLIKQHDPSNKTDIHATVIQLLTGTNMPSSQHIYERHFVHKSLQLLLYIDELDSTLTSILMGYYSEGNSEIQDMILGIYVCIYVCAHVCTYICMYVCMYVCMYICTCMYVCIYVCMYLSVCLSAICSIISLSIY